MQGVCGVTLASSLPLFLGGLAAWTIHVRREDDRPGRAWWAALILSSLAPPEAANSTSQYTNPRQIRNSPNAIKTIKMTNRKKRRAFRKFTTVTS